ncbi:hypothetical protein [Corynebacterium sp. UBA2622]|uniref:hypothetical protein n=1 Tax=Corynebacterium sp. UBA2622 TaxID=1946393 RepID=UPI0025BF4859|nr:hypothetical protein [Corynebacterium sp. UBA2622]
MKLRKGFIAAATAAAMVTGGMAAAPAQAEPTTLVLAAGDAKDAPTDSGSSNLDFGSSLGNMDDKALGQAGKIITILSGLVGLIAGIAGIVTKYFMK